MSDPRLPPAVRALIDAYVTTMTHVEVLLFVRREPSRPWRAADLPESVTGGSEPAARRCLEELQAARLLVGSDAGEGYRYAPGSDDLRDATTELDTLYNQRPVTLVRALYSRPATAVRSFADAFRLRREET